MKGAAPKTQPGEALSLGRQIMCARCGRITASTLCKAKWHVHTSLAFSIGNICGYVSESVSICADCFPKLLDNATNFVKDQLRFADRSKEIK